VIVRLLLALLLVSGCGSLSAPEPEAPLSGGRLVEALREGGLVLYLRHTATEEDAPDGLPSDPCEQQRALTAAGRAEARAIGAAVEALEVPVGRVVASPFCRTAETAELAFAATETDEALLPIERGPGAEQAGAAVRELLGDDPEEGTNTVLVGHISNLRPATGATPQEGGTVVFRPHGKGAFRVVAEIAPGGWQHLAQQHT
jgi:phosphohistidine phosphatase SixA